MKIELKKLDTEQNNPNSSQIELKNSLEIITLINQQDQLVPLAVQKCLPQIAKLVDQIVNAFLNGGRLIYMGAGTSGRLGVLDASECPPTYGVSFDMVQGLIAGGFGALLKAKEGAEDDVELGKQDLIDLNLTSKDVVVGIAASGRTPYVIGGLEYAKSIGCVTGSIACVTTSAIGEIADFPINCPVGPEIVTGSTRMKSGTAQKLILNMLSTASMIQMGKVYNGYMVDVQCTNQKLVERAKRIIMNTTGCSYEVAEENLVNANYNVKIAILTILSGTTKEQAQNLLDTYQGNIAKAMHALKK